MLQLVPSGAPGAGWVQKAEEPTSAAAAAAAAQESLRVSSLAATSASWAAQPKQSSGAWLPPGAAAAAPQAPGRGPSFPADRHLNPEEYPSLAATARSNSQPQKRPAFEHPVRSYCMRSCRVLAVRCKKRHAWRRGCEQ